MWWTLGRGPERGVRYVVSGQSLNWDLPLSPSLYPHTLFSDKYTENM